MKRLKILALILTLLLMSSLSFAASSAMKVVTVVDAQTIEASGTYTSSAVNFGSVNWQYQAEGIFSIQVAISGDGTAKIEYLLSIDGTNYLEPSSASDIATGLVKTSGPGSDGKDIFSFSPELAKFLKIKVTETGTSDSVTATVYLIYQ